jgi:hypothetical protein
MQEVTDGLWKKNDDITIKAVASYLKTKSVPTANAIFEEWKAKIESANTVTDDVSPIDQARLSFALFDREIKRGEVIQFVTIQREFEKTFDLAEKCGGLKLLYAMINLELKTTFSGQFAKMLPIFKVQIAALKAQGYEAVFTDDEIQGVVDDDSDE